jgi:hypothetical protein
MQHHVLLNVTHHEEGVQHNMIQRVLLLFSLVPTSKATAASTTASYLQVCEPFSSARSGMLATSLTAIGQQALG